MITKHKSSSRYTTFLTAVAGLGGLLYGIDVGIIAAALLYLSKTVQLSVEQTSVIVAAVLGGGMLSSLVAGILADWLGRRTMMVVSGVIFVASVGVIVLSQSFTTLFLGRLLQGVSGGVIAVVVPLYLAECLSANHRGRGTAVFQFMLTAGIVVAACVGWFYTHQAEHAISLAAGDPVLIRAAENHAWRGMFLFVAYPGLLFVLGTLFLTETPRWLFRKGQTSRAKAALSRLVSPAEAELQLREMEALATDSIVAGAKKQQGSLLQRRYVAPFVLACVILAFNQATGINSVLGFLVVILKQAGMTATHATQGDVAVKVLNCLVTIIAIALVDRKGRRFLLRIGTGGIILSLLAGAALFYGFESRRIDLKDQVQSAVQGDHLSFPLSAAPTQAQSSKPMSLTVLYTYGTGDHVATVLSSDSDPVLHLSPESQQTASPIRIKHAFFGPVPDEKTGWLITICLGFFISFFAVGPGVVVWLTLSELMPTRIRSTGMGIALLLNQGISTLIAAVFLPIVGNYGFHAMFGFWALCTVVYFVTATFFLPETKGKTLEEIEAHFRSSSTVSGEVA